MKFFALIAAAAALRLAPTMPTEAEFLELAEEAGAFEGKHPACSQYNSGEEAAAAAFAEYDKDKSGSIDKAELTNFFSTELKLP